MNSLASAARTEANIDLAALASVLLPSPPALNFTADDTTGSVSDFDLNPGARPKSDLPWRPAAVLVPIVLRDVPTLLFTVRHAGLTSHAGQIAFPGGKVDGEDASPREAALREAEEEIGLDRRFVTTLGFLDCYRTGTGYCIAPVVGAVLPSFELTLNPDEVTEAFELPLSFFLRREAYQLRSMRVGKAMRKFHALGFGDRLIWGATAGILKSMQERLARG